MTSPEIGRYRMVNQQLGKTKIESAVEMVQWFGAVQGQEFAQSKWGLGLRLPNVNANDIERYFTEGTIFRTHLLRPTWHFVAAQDIWWLLTLTAPRVNAVNAYMYRQLELDKPIFNRCIKILIKTLQGSKQLTRNVINEEFRKNKIIAKGHRLSYIMMYAELAGVICSGARKGNQFTYALLEERVAATNLLHHDEALAELTKRYFTSRGPATIKDFSTWSGLTLADCRKGVEMTKSNFERDAAEGEVYYFPYHIKLSKKRNQQIYLLPVYDEFIMGYKDRNAIFDLRNHLKPEPPFYDCMIVLDGQIIGKWKRTVTKKVIIIKCRFFRPLGKNETEEFKIAVDRFQEFTNTAVKVVIEL